MEVCIPFLPARAGEVFMLYQQGQGYGGTPNGPSCPFIHRESDENVTELEITKALQKLEVSQEVFWEIQDHAAQSEKPIKGAATETPDAPQK